MSLPFQLNFFRKIEIYQDLKELDNDFYKALKDTLQRKSAVYPTWYLEKKILYWIYTKHKHQGSPLKIWNFHNRGYEWFENRGLKNPESTFEGLMEYADRDEICKNRQEEIGITSQELINTSIEKVFGNLETKGLVKFWRGDDLSTSLINQDNCHGVLLTEKGYYYSRMLNILYKLGDVFGSEKEIPGVEKVLVRKKWKQFFYFLIQVFGMSLILASALALILSTLEKIYSAMYFF